MFKDVLTDQRLLTQLLSFCEVILPLEEGKSLVDERQDVHAHWLRRFLHLDSSIELLNGFLVFLLIQQQLTVVVVHVGHFLEVLHAPPKGRHRRCNATHLVLCDTELDVREDEVLVKVDRLLVVLGGIAKLGLDEVELCTVVVDIGIIFVLRKSGSEVRFGGIRVCCE